MAGRAVVEGGERWGLHMGMKMHRVSAAGLKRELIIGDLAQAGAGQATGGERWWWWLRGGR